MTVIEAPVRRLRGHPLVAPPQQRDWAIDAVPAVRPKIERADHTDRDGRVLGLDGLRGLAVLLVIAFHEGWLRGGFIGVDIFFVVSGYVITRLVLPSHRRGGLGTFWARRVRRLIPALLALLAAAQVWAHYFAPSSQTRLLNGQTRSAVAYVANWYAIVAHSGYWETATAKTPLLHLWSLGVEEQFYIVWPLVVLGALTLSSRRVQRWFVPATVGLASASFVATIAMSRFYGADRAYYGTDTRIGMILVGAALAFWHERTSPARRRSLPRATSPVAWLVIVGAAVTLSTTGGFYFTGGQALVAAAALALVVLAVQQAPSRTRTFLSSRALVWLGLRSYGLYLWSWPIQILVTHERTGLSGLPLLSVKAFLLLATTQVSYHLLETPIRCGKFQGIRLGGVLLPGIAVVIVASFVFQQAPPVEFGSGAVLMASHASTGSLRILVVGDSWARNIGAGLVMADDGHRDTVLNDGIASCGLTNLPTKSGGVVRNVDPACADWPTRWRQEVSSFRPDVAVLVTGRWDQAATLIDGTYTRPGSDAYRRTYEPRLDEAISVLGSTGAPVYVANVVDNAMSSERVWSSAINGLLRDAVRRNHTARLLDVRGLLCPAGTCPERLNGAVVYDETRHLTPGWQKRLGAIVLDRLHLQVTPAEGDATTARRASADAVLPAPAVLAGSDPEAVGYPVPDDLVSDLVVGVTPEDRALTALAGAVTTTSRSGERLRAIGMRFGDDATPDRMATTAANALSSAGWQRIPIDPMDAALFVKGGTARLFLRSVSALTVVESSGPLADVSTRAMRLLSITPRIEDHRTQ